MAEVISNMEKVISMVQKLFDVEFKALSASLVERDDSLFTNQISELKGYFEKNVQNDIRRPENPSEEWFQLGEEVLAKGKLCPRLIFQVKRYRHKQYGDLFRVYASSTTQPAPGQSGYSICLFITDWEEKLLVISRYDRDVIPMQDGVRLKKDTLLGSGTVVNNLLLSILRLKS